MSLTFDNTILRHLYLTRCHGREKTDHEDVTALIDTMPMSLWSTGPTDVGRCKIQPVSFKLTPAPPVWVLQYKNKPEALEGIRPTIMGLLRSGVLVPHQSLWNTLILPVPKLNSDKYWMVHDLRQIIS